MPDPIYIGIDAGGTKTALLARSISNETIVSLDGPGANLRRDGVSKTASRLAQLILELPQSSTLNTTKYIYAGVAGASNNEIQESLRHTLSAQLSIPKSNIQIRADASIAYYAAHRDRSGILVITGTGSIIWGRTKTGQMVRAGGWGALLGDEGGGFQVGLAALRALSLEIDGGPSTLLSKILCEYYGICTSSHILDFTYKQKEKISTLAPFVLEALSQGDQVAARIIHQQVSALAQSLHFLLLSHSHISPTLVYMGGLTRNEQYVKALKQALLSVHSGLTISPLKISPVEAAFDLAIRNTVGNDTS